MKLLSVVFKEEIQLHGSKCLPRSICMVNVDGKPNKDDERDFEIEYDPRMRIIEVTIKSPTGPLHSLKGHVYEIDQSRACSWRCDPEEKAAFRAALEKGAKKT